MRDVGPAPQSVTSYDYLESPDAPFIPSWSGWDEAPDAADANAEPGADRVARVPAPTEKAAGPEFERRLAEERQRSHEAGRARGREEGRKAEHEAQVADGEQRRIRQIAGLLEDFAAQREQYFQAVEPEVVRLSLAVAARILRREAASDPLLLMGAVRAALGQISGSTEVRLRVPAAELGLWTEAIALLPNLAVKPAVLADDGMVLGQCRVETALGTADLGVHAQLAEVERALLGGSDAQAPRREPASADAESAS